MGAPGLAFETWESNEPNPIIFKVTSTVYA
jgi:hypothetical protein